MFNIHKVDLILRIHINTVIFIEESKRHGYKETWQFLPGVGDMYSNNSWSFKGWNGRDGKINFEGIQYEALHLTTFRW